MQAESMLSFITCLILGKRQMQKIEIYKKNIKKW
ncbi:hypothetical protein KCO_06970 [Pectobacterium brasiliense ICMP 19477]|nr:hypothetical protein KCO_06970 [Pectobacterium brasiliense ICMP 19477]